MRPTAHVLALTIVVCLIAAQAAGQYGHPLKGSWSGDWGPNKEQRTRVLLELQWDGKEISGAINPGPNALPLTKASLDPDTWQVHLEAMGVVIDGKLENIGAYQRVITGTWVQGATKGNVKVVRN